MSVQVDLYRETLLLPPSSIQFSTSKSRRLPSPQEIRLARSVAYCSDRRLPNAPSTQYEIRRPMRSSSSISSSSSSSTVSRHDSVLDPSSRPSSPSNPPSTKPRTYFKTGYRPTSPSTPPSRVAVTTSAVSSSKPPIVKQAPNSRRNPIGLLPAEVFGRIFQYLEVLHTREGGGPSLYTRDLYNLSLASRTWNHVSRKHLYTKLWISSGDLQPPPTKLLGKTNLRLKGLRRTLRQRNELAQSVQEIIILNHGHNLETLGDVPKEILDSLASVIASCPNLEKISGLYTTYNHEYSRLTQALSTRNNLKELVWIIGPNGGTWNGETLFVDRRYAHNPLNGDQVRGFVQMHENWQSLKTLVLCSDHDGTLDHPRLFRDTFKSLPTLQNLMISGFIAQEFDDSHLSSLPRTLRSLRFEDLPGITEEGLVGHLATALTPGERASLRNLSLTDMNFQSLANVALLLTLLPELRRLTLVTSALLLPPNTTISDFAAPALSSRSLTHLHWEVHPSSNTPSSEPAHALLASSIRAAGFPVLRRLRAPNDPHATLQAACRPIPLPMSRRTDKAYFTSRGRCYTCVLGSPCDHARDLTHTQARAIGRAMRAVGSWRTTAPGGSSAASSSSSSSSSAAAAAAAAATRSSTSRASSRSVPPSPGLSTHSGCSDSADASAPEPFARIIVCAPDGRVVDEVECAPFLGTLGPGVPEYWLDADVEGSEEAVMSVVHLLEGGKGWGAPGLERFF